VSRKGAHETGALQPHAIPVMLGQLTLFDDPNEDPPSVTPVTISRPVTKAQLWLALQHELEQGDPMITRGQAKASGNEERTDTQ
jgi:hypothetical protein